MTSVPSSHTWVDFFQDAGISDDLSARYAVMFSDHRIKKDMLPDLDRDVLSDIGIKAVGDKMAILKHAKFVAEQEKRDASSKKLADGINRSNKSSSPTDRTIGSDTNNQSLPLKKVRKISPKQPKKDTNIGKVTSEVEVKTVFDRLGKGAGDGVFSRLGGQSEVKTPVVGVVRKPQVPTNTNVVVLKKKKPSNILSRLGAEVENETPDSSSSIPPVTHVVPPGKKVVSLKKKPVEAPKLSQTISVRRDVVRSLPKTKPNILDRLGSRVTPADKTVPKVVKKPARDTKVVSLAPKKQPNLIKISPKRKLTGDLGKAVVPPKKQPISSNTVSSTSAGLFRGGERPSVFDRLGKK